jgi:hypothetical protein
MAKRLNLDFFKKEGRKGGKARAKKLTAKQRSESARRASTARWNRKDA